MLNNKRIPCKTFFHHDYPIEKDDFDGSYERIAQSIARLINENQAEGKSIGIEGSWGSGKSSIISLLDQNLKQKEGVHVFVFDAWIHKDDPLRRSFLEKLIESIAKREDEWITPKQKKNFTMILRGEKTTTWSRNKSPLTSFGKLMSIFTFFLPLGLIFVSQGLKDGLCFTNCVKTPNLNFLLGAFFFLLPIITLCIKLICHRCKQNKMPPKQEKNDAWEIFTRQTEVKAQITSIKTINPTSVEFEKLFYSIVKLAIGEKKRKIVLILDNIDRVLKEDALSLLSSIQNTISSDNECTRIKEFRSNITTIITYDKQGLSKLWMPDKSIPENEIEKINLINSFFDKKFQLIYRVPTILFTKWREYFLDLLKQSFPVHNNDISKLNLIFSIFRSSFSGSNPPTPREMKVFVNQMAILHSIWCPEVDLSSIAYYCSVIRKQDKFDFEKNVIAINADQFLREGLEKKQIMDDTAVLKFNLPKNIAMKHFFEFQIATILTRIKNEIDPSTDHERTENLLTLEESDKETFWTVLTASTVNIFAISTLEDVLFSIEILRQSKLLDTKLSAEQMGFIKRIQDCIFTFEKIQFITKKEIENLIYILSLVQNKKLAKKYLLSIKTGLPETPTLEITQQSIMQFRENFFTNQQYVLSFLHKNYKDIIETGGLIETPYETPIMFELFINFLVSKEDFLISIFEKKFQSTELSNYIHQMISSNLFDTDYLALLNILKEENRELDYSQISTELYKILTIDSCYDPDLFLTALLLFSENDIKTNEIITSIGNPDFGILNTIFYCKNKSLFNALGIAIYFFLSNFSTINHPTSTANYKYSEGFGIFIEILTNPDSYESVTEILSGLILEKKGLRQIFSKLPLIPQTAPFFNKILLICINKGVIQTQIDGEYIFQNWNIFEKYIDESVKQSLIGIDYLNTSIKEQLLHSENIFDYCTLISLMLRMKLKIEDVIQRIIIEMNNWSEEKWEEVFTAENQIFEFLLDIYKVGEKLCFTTNYRNALLNILKRIIDGSFIPKKSADDWKSVIQCLNINERKLLVKEILDQINQSSSISEVFYAIFGEFLADRSIILSNSEIVRKLFIRIISDLRMYELKWLLFVFEKYPRLLSKYKQKEDTIAFINQIDTTKHSSPEEIKEILEKIKKNVN